MQFKTPMYRYIQSYIESRHHLCITANSWLKPNLVTDDYSMIIFGFVRFRSPLGITSPAACVLFSSVLRSGLYPLPLVCVLFGFVLRCALLLLPLAAIWWGFVGFDPFSQSMVAVPLRGVFGAQLSPCVAFLNQGRYWNIWALVCISVEATLSPTLYF